MESYPVFLRILPLIVVAIATVTDLRFRKIPNKLTFPAAGAGIVCQALARGFAAPSGDWVGAAAAGAGNGLLGWVTGVVIMSVTKAFLRKFGHGDTKLVAAVGAFLGPVPVLVVYFYYSLCFGFWSLIQMAIALPWSKLWFAQEVKKAGMEAPSVDLDRFHTIRKGLVPVAPFIAIGTLLTVLLYDQTLKFIGMTP